MSVGEGPDSSRKGRLAECSVIGTPAESGPPALRHSMKMTVWSLRSEAGPARVWQHQGGLLAQSARPQAGEELLQSERRPASSEASGPPSGTDAAAAPAGGSPRPGPEPNFRSVAKATPSSSSGSVRRYSQRLGMWTLNFATFWKSTYFKMRKRLY